MTRNLLKRSIWLLMALSIAGSAAAAQSFYSAEFKGWRDNRTNKGFHALFTPGENFGTLFVPTENSFGKVMTPEAPIEMDFSEELIFQVIVDEMGAGASLSVEIMEAQKPYTSFKILEKIEDPGVYNVNLGKVTKWKGPQTFWIAIWIGPSGASAKVSRLRIGKNLVEMKPGAKVSKQVKGSNVFKRILGKEEKIIPVDYRENIELNYQYFEEWKSGLEGWRYKEPDNTVETIAKANISGGVHVSLPEKAVLGRFMSPEEPIRVDLDEFPYLEVEIDREIKKIMDAGTVKVKLVQANTSSSVRTLINNFSRPGVYMVHVPEATGWTGEQSLFVEVWLEQEGTEVFLKAIGFSSKMATQQGVLTSVQSIKAIEMAPGKDKNALRVSGVADQCYSGTWFSGAALGDDWTAKNRWGSPLRYLTYNQILQKMYLITAIKPYDKVEIWASLGYDFVNAFNGVYWEDKGGRYVDARLDYGLVRYKDLYIGNVAQVGSVYEPLFTDMTFKRSSTLRGVLWKPRFGDVRFKFFGTRLETSGETNAYQDNVFLTGARAVYDYDFSEGNLRLGVSAVNMMESGGSVDVEAFQGPTERSAETFKNYSPGPSLYFKIQNYTDGNLFFDSRLFPTMHIDYGEHGSKDVYMTGEWTFDDSNVLDEFDVYEDSVNDARGIHEGGYIVLQVRLKNENAEWMDTGYIQGISGITHVDAWVNTLNGNVDSNGWINVSVSSDGQDWQSVSEYEYFYEPPREGGPEYSDVNGDNINDSVPRAEFYSVSADQLIKIKNGTFNTDAQKARSLLGVDVKGQIAGIDIAAEVDVSLAHNQGNDGKRFVDMGRAGYVQLSRDIRGAVVKAACFKVEKNYSTQLKSYNTIDDNDNRAILEDSHGDKAGVIFGDYYNLGKPDFEDVNGILIPKDYNQHESGDLNHNGLLDNRENDHLSDYTYRQDQQGIDFSAVIPRKTLEGTYAKDIEINLQGHVVQRLSKPGINQHMGGSLAYKNTDIDDLIIKVGVYGARVIDHLSKQYVYYSVADQEINTYTSYSIVEGDGTTTSVDRPSVQEYTNDIIVTPEMMVDYRAPFGLNVTLLDRFRYTQEVDDEHRKFMGNEAHVQVRYKHYWIGSLISEPVFKGRYGARLARLNSSIHNSYYTADMVEQGDDLKWPLFHGFYLKNSVMLFREYKLSVDIGREYSMNNELNPDEMKDMLVVGMRRDLPQGSVKLLYELTKVYYDSREYKDRNWGTGAFLAQLIISF
jgi:hypothetical protein